MRAADPAVDAAYLHAVELAPRARARRSSSARSSNRANSCPSLSGGGAGSASPPGLDQPPVTLPRSRQRTEEPGVAEERRLLEALRRDERGDRRGGAVRERLQDVALGRARARRPAPAAPRAAGAGPERRMAARTRRPPARRAPWIGRADGGPSRRGRLQRSSARARSRAGHSVSSSPAVSSPSPANAGLPGNEPTTISSGVASCSRASASASTS